MKRTTKLMGASLLFAAALPGQQDDWKEKYMSQGRVNCRFFNDADFNQRFAYLAGVFDSTAAHTTDPIWTIAATYGEAINGIEAICSVPENARIRVIDAYDLFLAKTKGASDSAISAATADARRYAIYGPEPEVPKPPKLPTKKEKL